MSNISNVPKKRNFLIQAIRELMEHRATWLALVLKEVGKKGIEWEEVGDPAIRACGNMHGQNLVDLAGTSSLKGLKKKLFTKPAQMIFDMKILKSTDNELSIDFGFCPLVAAWQKLDCSDEEIAKLCDIAMEGDRGIAEKFGARLELGETISNGHKCCQLRFKK